MRLLTPYIGFIFTRKELVVCFCRHCFKIFSTETVEFLCWQADFDLCPDCYNEGLFGPDMVSADFIKMDVTTASNANGGGWSDQETLLLLEALELYGDNWNEIAEHVATKSKSQCILHFIKLPVEDAFSDNVAKSASTSNAAPATTPISQTDSTLEGEQEEKETGEKEPEDDAAIVPSTDKAEEPRREELVLPPNLAAFAEAGNPVMAQVRSSHDIFSFDAFSSETLKHKGSKVYGSKINNSINRVLKRSGHILHHYCQ